MFMPSLLEGFEVSSSVFFDRKESLWPPFGRVVHLTKRLAIFPVGVDSTNPSFDEKTDPTTHTQLALHV